mmetsp:Transcript_109258/g.341826  ORF Transcript_109258/g.341826 Transcript_109258/m.341826 type:complete len:369 (+) Transcript_109258:372-1478(+)
MDAVEEVALTDKLVRSANHVCKVAQGVNDDEGNQEQGRADGASAVVVQLDVVREEDPAGDDEPHEVQESEDHSTHNARDAAVALRARRLLRPRGRGLRRLDRTAHLALLGYVGHILLHCARLVDHLPLVCGVLAHVCHDGGLAARVDGDPLRHIDGLAEEDDPRVLLRVVLGHLVHTDAARIGWCCSRSSPTAACAYLSHLRDVRQVLLHGARLVDHLPLVRGVLAQVGADCLLAARVDGDPLGHVKGLAEEYDPRIVLLVVLGDLLHRDARGSSGGSRGRGGHHCTAGLQLLNLGKKLLLAHVLELLLLNRLLVTSSRLRSLGICGEAADDQVSHLLDGHVLAFQGISRCCSGCHAARVDAMQQRDA